jgi:hypothetical protein
VAGSINWGSTRGSPRRTNGSFAQPSGFGYVRFVGPVNEFGKVLVMLGLVLVLVGALLWSGIGRGWLGRLPGDIHYSRGNFSFSFPIVTCLLISILLTLFMWLFRR